MNLNRSHKIVLAALLAAQNFLAAAQTTNALAPGDYPKYIASHNIFNPNRLPNAPYYTGPTRPYVPPLVVKNVDSFSLVGIIGYNEGQLAGVYAFFDGTKSQYQETAQVNGSIATFKITDISADSVTLMSDTNSKTVLMIGEQLHNDGIGHWLTESGTAARYYNNGGFGGGRGGRNGLRNGNGLGNGFGGNGNGNGFGGRRRNNFGNGNNGNFNGGGNNFGGAAGFDNSQGNGQDMIFQDGNAAADDNAAPDDNTPPDPGQQNN